MKNLSNSIIGGFLLGTMALCTCQILWAYETLTWEDCLKQSSLHHPDLISAKEGVRQAKNDQRITQSSFLPQASANLSVTQNQSNDRRTDTKTKSTTYAYGLSGSQLLFDGFKTKNNIKASQENVKASQWNFQFVSAQVRHRLRTAFVNLLKAQELNKITQEIYLLRKKNVDLITLRYNSGTEHRGALLTAQANLARAEFEIHQADRNASVVQSSLLKEIGIKKAGQISIKGYFDMTGDYQQDPDVEELVKNNPQLLKLAAKTKAALFDVKASEGNLWPSISLIGGAGSSDDRWAPQEDSANVGLKLTWPIFAGGLKLAQLDQSKSVLKDLEAQQKSLQDELTVALRQAWALLQDAMEQVGVQKSFLAAAEERARIAQGQYAVGLISFDNWTIIEDDLVANKKIFLNTQANALLAEANWIETQGRTLEYAQ